MSNPSSLLYVVLLGFLLMLSVTKYCYQVLVNIRYRNLIVTLRKIFRFLNSFSLLKKKKSICKCFRTPGRGDPEIPCLSVRPHVCANITSFSWNLFIIFFEILHSSRNPNTEKSEGVDFPRKILVYYKIVAKGPEWILLEFL